MGRNRAEADARLQTQVEAGTFVPNPPTRKGNGFSRGSIETVIRGDVAEMRAQIKARADKARDPAPLWKLERRKQDQIDKACAELDHLNGLPKP